MGYETYRGGSIKSPGIESSTSVHVTSLGRNQRHSSSNGQTCREAGTQSHGPGRSQPRPIGPPGCRGVRLIEARRPASAHRPHEIRDPFEIVDTMTRRPFRLESSAMSGTFDLFSAAPIMFLARHALEAVLGRRGRRQPQLAAMVPVAAHGGLIQSMSMSSGHRWDQFSTRF
jgi:hypothetical protein